MKRKHQKDFEDEINAIITGRSQARVIVARVTPGGGKSALPIIAGKLKTAGLVDAISWIVPRYALKNQGERNFMDPFFRKMFNHRISIRSAVNEADPCRGLDGFVTTYQAVGMDKNGVLAHEFSQKRYAVILDEFHHVEASGAWHKALYPIIEKAYSLILMTGTLERGDGQQVAFITYSDFKPDFTQSDYSIIEYSRRDALQEKAILPISFHLSTGSAKWKKTDGEERSVDDLSKAAGKDLSAAIYTALHTDFAKQIANKAVAHWNEYRRTVPTARMLFVAANLKPAKNYLRYLQGLGLNAEIATSHSSKSAVESIKRFKAGKLDALVTIAMAYEGLDVPEASHVACLTNIRSKPWIEQMAARAVRVDRASGVPYEKQMAHIFAPDDPLFRGIMESIKRDQLPIYAEGPKQAKEQLGLFDDEEVPGEKRPPVTPLGSQVTNFREVFFDRVKTPSEREEEIRGLIEKRIRAFCAMNRYKTARINFEIKEKFGGKSRSDMTLNELEGVWSHVQANYPISYHVRGTGRRCARTSEPFTARAL